MVIAVWFNQLYFLRDDNGGEIVWNAKEVFLFMHEARRGYRMGYFEYPWAILMELFHAPPPPKDERKTLTVIYITSSEVGRHSIEISGNLPDLLTPIGNTIYANCEGTLCKWNGKEFEPAIPNEEREVGGIAKLLALGFDNRDGWSKHFVGAIAGGGSFSVPLPGGSSILVRQGNSDKSSYDPASIDLLRPSQNPERLWYVDGNPHLVSKWEYGRVFR